MQFSFVMFAEPVVLDLSRSHSLEDILESKLDFREIPGGTKERDFAFKDQEIMILLPGNRSFQQKVVLGTIDSENDMLTRVSTYGNVMPHEEAIQVVNKFHNNFNLPLENFYLWESANRSKVRNAEPYSVSANLNFYPRLSLGIKKSMNGQYPWVIQLSISWDWEKHRDWNEERVWRELPLPEISKISLNPPSGLTYYRKDAYKDTLIQQTEYEQELTDKGIVLPHLQKRPNPPITIPQEVTKPTKGGSLKKPTPTLLIICIVLLVLSGGLLLRKSRK